MDRDRVRRLAVPTLILSGSETQAVAKLTDPELERLIPEPSRQRIILPSATHNMWLERSVPSRSAAPELIRGE